MGDPLILQLRNSNVFVINYIKMYIIIMSPFSFKNCQCHISSTCHACHACVAILNLDDDYRADFRSPGPILRASR